VKKWVALLVGFNVFDAVATIYVVSRAMDVESNPLVSFLYGFHPLVWLAVKFSLVLLGCVAALGEPERYYRLTFIVVTVFYGLLSLFQIAVLIFLLKGSS
jgi:hypothetical protein